MARKARDGVNRSAAIRELLQQNPNMPSKEVMVAMKSKGIPVRASLVYMLKSKMKKAGVRAKRTKAMNMGREMGMPDSVTLVVRVRELANQAGGMRHLKKLVDVLAE